MSKKKATLKDVAKLANVGVGSVSRYLNDNTSIKLQNRQRIQNAIAQLNYVPNEAARKLALGKSRNIMLLLLSEIPVMLSTWIYEKEIIQEIYEMVENSEYTLQLSMFSIKKQAEIYNMLNYHVTAKNLEGLIVLTSWELEANIQTFLLQANLPFMVVGSKQKLLHSNEVLIDNAGAMEQAVKLLAENKQKKIALFTGNKNQEHMAERIKGYKAALKKYKCKPSKGMIWYGDYSMESGYENARLLLQQGKSNLPNAILCGNDLIACGAVKALREQKIKIPKEISIVGFDNLPMTEVMNPPLASFQLSSGMGSYAARKVFEMIELSSNTAKSKVFGCTLVVRDSIKMQ